MTETSYLYDPEAFDRARAEEEERLREAKPASVADSDTSEADRMAELRRLAEEGLSKVSGMIGQTAAENTLNLVTSRHGHGHNKTTPNYTSEI